MPETTKDEATRQREAEAHRKPYGQFEEVHVDGAEGTEHHLEKTTSREPVETSLRGTEDAAPEAHRDSNKARE